MSLFRDAQLFSGAGKCAGMLSVHVMSWIVLRECDRQRRRWMQAHAPAFILSSEFEAVTLAREGCRELEPEEIEEIGRVASRHTAGQCCGVAGLGQDMTAERPDRCTAMRAQQT